MRMMRRAGLLDEVWEDGSYSGNPTNYDRPSSEGLRIGSGSSVSNGYNPTSNTTEATFRPSDGANYGYYLFSPNINVRKIKDIEITCKVKAGLRISQTTSFSLARIGLGIYNSINKTCTLISSTTSVKKGSTQTYTLSNINTSSLTALNLSNLCIYLYVNQDEDETAFFGFNGADLTITYKYK